MRYTQLLMKVRFIKSQLTKSQKLNPILALLKQREYFFIPIKKQSRGLRVFFLSLVA